MTKQELWTPSEHLPFQRNKDPADNLLKNIYNFILNISPLFLVYASVKLLLAPRMSERSACVEHLIDWFNPLYEEHAD
jgi:hypothetical protein